MARESFDIQRLARIKDKARYVQPADVSPELRDHILSRVSIEAIPATRRTKDQKQRLEEAIEEIQDDLHLTITRACQYYVDQIRVVSEMDDDGFSAAYAAVGENKPPKYPEPVSVSTVNEALGDLYRKMNNVSAFLAMAEPTLALWQQYEKTMLKRVKAIMGTDNAWQAEASFATWYPQDCAKAVQELEELVDTYKHLEKMLERSFNIISRQMTLYQNTPGDEVSRSSMPETPEYAPRKSASLARDTEETAVVSSSGKKLKMFGG